MKTKRLLLPVLLLSLVMLGATCKKKDDDKPQLPPISQTGEGTFGCLVNGEVWLPKGRILAYSEYTIQHESYMDILYIDIYVNHDGKSGFRFSIPKESIQLGKNTIKREIGRGSGFSYSDGQRYYFTDESVGTLMITSLDTITNNNNVTPYRITAGTFWFNLFSEDGEKIEIQEGRFDFRDYRNEYRK